jgi:hypothetical protein
MGCYALFPSFEWDLSPTSPRRTTDVAAVRSSGGYEVVTPWEPEMRADS